MRLATAAALAAAGAALAIGCAIQQARPVSTARLEIDASPVEIGPAELNGLRLRSAVALTSTDTAVGGISGMVIEDGTLTAVTDHGSLMQSPLSDDAPGLRPIGGRIFLLRDASGARLRGKDAEALARLPDGGLAIAFEHRHRVEILDGDIPSRTITDRRLKRLGENKGLEALATLPDGRLIALAEAPENGAFPVFILDADGVVATGTLPQVGRYLVTGADVGPDGRLYLLRRDFSLLRGFSAQIERYRLGPDGLPVPQTREELAAFQSGSGIDNMEAIAIWRDAGGTRLTIASDNNFLFLQRTLLIDFDVLD